MSDLGALTARLGNAKATDILVSKAYVCVLCSSVSVIAHDLKPAAGCEIGQSWGSQRPLLCALNSEQCKCPRSEESGQSRRLPRGGEASVLHKGE